MSIGLSPAGSGYLSHAGPLASNSAHTFFLRFRVDTLPASGELGCILTFLENTNFTGYSLGILDSGILRLNNANGDSNTDGTTVLSVDTIHTLWIRVTGSGAAQTCSVYLDGSTTAEIAGPGTTWVAATGSLELRIGYRLFQSAQTQAFGDVDVDDCRLWSVDKAASGFQAEVDADNVSDATSLRGEWRLPDPSTLTDSSGNGLTLTLNGTGATTETSLFSKILVAAGLTYSLTLADAQLTKTGASEPPGLVIGSPLSFIGEGAIGAPDEAAAGDPVLVAAGATYALTLQPVGLKVARTLPADGLSFSLSLADVTLRVGRKVSAESASYALTMAAVDLRTTRTLVAAGASYSLTLQDATLRPGRVLSAASLALFLNMADADLVWSGAPPPSGGDSFNLALYRRLRR